MPELKKILETETARSNDRPDSLTIIDLYREGSFWLAYEWSALLFVKFVRDFNVNKRKIKGGEGTYVFIGFPDTSLAGISESFSVIPLDDKHLRLNIPVETLSDKVGVQEWNKELETWKDGFAVSEAKSKRENKERNATNIDDLPFVDSQPKSRHTPITSYSQLIRKILGYPLESRTPIENMQFISELQSDISNLI